MEIKGMDQVLSQLRTAAAMASGGIKPQPVAAEGAKSLDFAGVLKASLDQVNGMQEQGAKQARDFELGAPNANLQDVMVSLQKANISFQQLVQVRNKLVSSYQEIMNMQV